MKIFVLAGKTMAGKSTVAEILESKYDIERTRSFTTRPIRKGEVNGVDYDFYDYETVLLLLTTGQAVAVRSYQPHEKFGARKWFYGFHKEVFEGEDDKLVVTDLHGIKDLKEEYGDDNVIVFYLDIKNDEQIKRAASRGEDLLDEQKRRIASDDIDFLGIEDIADHNISANKKPETIAKEIVKLIEKNS